MKYENIIIGGGLSGTILAWQFYLNNKSFLLIDDKPKSSSSKVAAGLYNPVVFKRLTPTWEADKIIPYLDEFYSKIENILNTKFHHKRNIIRIIPSEEDKALWEFKSQNNELNKYLNPRIIDNYLHQFIKAPYGLGIVNNAGNIDTNLFIETSHKFFIENNQFINTRINSNKASIKELKNKYSADRILFAEGWINSENEYFKWLPYKLVKGELLKLHIPNFDIHDVPNKRVFLLNVGNNNYLAGSTYRWSYDNELPTEAEKNYLIEHLDKFLIAKYNIIDHKAGIRPAVLDRRPLLGNHPDYKDILLFNGMGSKSVMLSPYLSQMLYYNIYNESEIHKEVNLNRYIKYLI
ncbi:FAD-dependent oxidoreductase [Candidatus Kapabacteria bacterium]|nr:FAD-dependent oxidoreductase [Candidatus Kapabacteria bacterium]